jgi:hypothetical protein
MGNTFGLELNTKQPSLQELRERLRNIMASDSPEERDRFFEELEKENDQED